MQAPYPADTRAKGWRLELDYEQIEQSDTWPLAAEIPMAQHALLMSWLVAWAQVPCGAMPADENLFRVKCRLSPEVWATMRHVVMRGWVQADDGRLYHPTLTKRVLEMMSKRRSDSDRQAKRRAAKPAEVTRYPPAITPVSRVTPPELGRESSTDHRPPTTEYNHTEDFHGRSASASDPGGDGEGNDDPPPFAPTKAGEIGMAMKRGGIDAMSLNLSDPRLATLIAQGATPEEFEGLVREAVTRGISAPFPWVMATLSARRADAARIALAPAQGPPIRPLTPGEARMLEACPSAVSESVRQRAAATAPKPLEYVDVVDSPPTARRLG